MLIYQGTICDCCGEKKLNPKFTSQNEKGEWNSLVQGFLVKTCSECSKAADEEGARYFDR